MEIGSIVLGTQDFWLLILVIVMVINKPYRLGAVALLAARCINDRVTWWSIAIIILFVIIMDGITAASNKKVLDGQLNQLNKRLSRLEKYLYEDSDEDE